MTTPLVDPEGFPRADIDVYAVRHARVSLNRLRNDHRNVVDRLGRVLEEVYAIGAVVEPRVNGAGGGKMVNGDGPGSGSSSASVRPLARVNMVSENSPSATAVRPACAYELQTSQVNGSHLNCTFPTGIGARGSYNSVRRSLIRSRTRSSRYRPTRTTIRRGMFQPWHSNNHHLID